MRTLVIAEYHNASLTKGTLSTIAAAKVLSHPIDVLVCTTDKSANLPQNNIEGVETFLTATLPELTAETIASIVADLAPTYNFFMAPASTFGKNILPRCAALLDVMQVSDVTHIINENTFEHPIYAGNLMETVEVLTDKKVLTIRTTAFPPADYGEGAPIIKEMAPPKGTIESPKIVKTESGQTGNRPTLANATRVISGGRGVQSQENFRLIEDLADCLGAAVGATRAAVDAGFIQNEAQVGQTGTMVAPELYIAVGISGAIQHIAGMKESKVIVAINKDPDAPIFKSATFGIVGDLFTIVPELITCLKNKQT